ncbi:hypothetical protein RMATCC62417_14116 [Rhizopus microsporus]|nr:hypothetical protein RMATCC62417_14116 [Rhizopus microsporus]
MVIITRGNMRLNYQFDGVGNSVDSPLIWLIHGAGGDLNHYDDLKTVLVKQSYRVLTCDIRYHGQSQPIDDQQTEFRFVDALDDLDYILSHLVHTHYPSSSCRVPLYISGLSMGGVLSLLYASRYEKDPEWSKQRLVELKGVIPIACTVPGFLRTREEWKKYQEPPTLSIIQYSKMAIVQSAKLTKSQEDINRAMSQISDLVLYQCFSEVANSLLVEQDMSMTKIPMLLIIPEHDVLTRQDMEDLYEINHQRNIKCQKVIIPDALHMVILDHSQQVADHIAQFCKD